MTEPLGNVVRLLPGITEQIKPKQTDKVQAESESGGNFTDVLTNLINSVNDLQKDSAQIQEAFLSGEPVELHQVMIKAEEAGLAMDLLLEIRNRLVNAYNQLLNMPM